MVEQTSEPDAEEAASEATDPKLASINSITDATRESLDNEETWWEAIRDFWKPLIIPPKHDGDFF